MTPTELPCRRQCDRGYSCQGCPIVSHNILKVLTRDRKTVTLQGHEVYSTDDGNPLVAIATNGYLIDESDQD